MSDGLRQNGESRYRYRSVPSGRGGGDHVDDLAAAYALGALEPTERERVERHCRVCPACADLIAEDARTVGFLPLAALQVRPAPDVKVALFARIAHAQHAAAEADLPTRRPRTLPPTLTIPASRPTASPATPAPAAEAPTRSFGPWGRRSAGSRLGWATTFLSVPLLLALVATGIWGMQLRAQVVERGTQLNDLQAQLANFAAGAVRYDLDPSSAAPQAKGSIVLDADQREGVLMVDLNSRGPGTYQMMVVKDGKLVPEAELQVNEQGVGQATFELDRPFDEYQSVQVQAKPLESGAADPTAPESILSGDIGGSIGSPGSGANSANTVP